MTQDSQTLTAEQTIALLNQVLDETAKELGCENDNEAILQAIHDLKQRASLPSPPVSGEAVTVDAAWEAHTLLCRINPNYLPNGALNTLSGFISQFDASASPLTNEPVGLGMTDAPRDGTAILGDVDGSAFVVWWDKMHSGWVSGHTDADDELYTRDVNGWMPLPIPQQEVQP